MTRVLSFLALTTLFVMGVALGGTVGPTPASAQSEQTCEQDECDPAPWWQFWTSDQCVMNAGYDTGCDWIGDGECATYSCGQALPGGGNGGDDDDD